MIQNNAFNADKFQSECNRPVDIAHISFHYFQNTNVVVLILFVFEQRPTDRLNLSVSARNY